jgi:transposase-like protein
MTKPIPRDPIYRKRAFDADIIELCVRWYITYRLSYRDLVEMMAERGVQVAHSTGDAVRPGVREALEPVLAIRRHVVEGR